VDLLGSDDGRARISEFRRRQNLGTSCVLYTTNTCLLYPPFNIFCFTLYQYLSLFDLPYTSQPSARTILHSTPCSDNKQAVLTIRFLRALKLARASTGLENERVLQCLGNISASVNDSVFLTRKFPRGSLPQCPLPGEDWCHGVDEWMTARMKRLLQEMSTTIL
jgi:hypothetical protein